jgi:hypothetical protein
MNEKNMILESLEKAPNPLMVKDIVKYIYHFFDGYVISKKDVKEILWGELKNEVLFNKMNFTYYSINKQIKLNTNPTDLQILNDIKESLNFIENRNQITVQKITAILNYRLSKQYNLFDIRRIYNKHDIAIFEHYNNINFENLHEKNIDKTNLNEFELPSPKVKKYNYYLDGYQLHVEEASDLLAPLFWVKSEGLRINIYVNILHTKYQLEKEETLIQLIAAMVRSSISFSDNSGEVFLNRTKNYLELL